MFTPRRPVHDADGNRTASSRGPASPRPTHSSGAPPSPRPGEGHRETDRDRSGPSTVPGTAGAADVDDSGEGWSPWRGSRIDSARRVADSSDTAALSRSAAGPPPPPRASARFPDAPPTAGREGRRESDGAPGREDRGQDASTGVPSRPAGRPPMPRRTGAPDETAAETTHRLRPLRGHASAEPGSRPASGAGATGVPPRPAARPGATTSGAGHRTGAVDASQRPGGAAPTDPAGHRNATTPGHRAQPLPPANPTTTTIPARDTAAPPSPDPALSWSAPMTPSGTPGTGRPIVSFGQPEGYDEQARPRPLGGRFRSRTAAAAACVVLGLGLIGGAVTGSWLVGEPGEGGARDSFTAAGNLWHSVPVDQLFPPTVEGQGAGPGGADRTWTRIAVAPDSDCADAFDALLRKALAPVGCQRLLRATYTDATQSYVTTVGLLFTKADSAAMSTLGAEFAKEGLGRRADLMPRPYAAKGTAAASFGPRQRASWTISVLTDAPVVVYAVSGWADGRTVDEPEPAEEALRSDATSAVAQAGLGHEAQGLADRIERALRKNVSSATEQSS